MKIYGSTNKIYGNIAVNRPDPKNEPAASPRKIATMQDVPNKIEVPKNFKPEKTLDKDEQVFFESLYPRARKEIQRYAQSQNKVQVEKGKFIDVRG